MKNRVKADQEVRIHRYELRNVLEFQYDSLWASAQEKCRCRRCDEGPDPDRPYRLFVNGIGDFVVYNNCRSCDAVLRHYHDLSEQRQLTVQVKNLWLSYHN
jgi:hypothetical protein